IEQIPCVVAAIVDHAARIFMRAAEEKGIGLNTHISPEVPHSVISDPVRLNQILANLLGNAVKFTAHGGVTLSVEWPGPGLLVFRLADTGIGIPQDLQARIITPFSQADAPTTRRFGGIG